MSLTLEIKNDSKPRLAGVSQSDKECPGTIRVGSLVYMYSMRRAPAAPQPSVAAAECTGEACRQPILQVSVTNLGR